MTSKYSDILIHIYGIRTPYHSISPYHDAPFYTVYWLLKFSVRGLSDQLFVVLRPPKEESFDALSHDFSLGLLINFSLAKYN